MKLYRVTLRGMTDCPTGTSFGHPYVVAKNVKEAVDSVQDYMEERELGFSYEREWV